MFVIVNNCHERAKPRMCLSTYISMYVGLKWTYSNVAHWLLFFTIMEVCETGKRYNMGLTSQKILVRPIHSQLFLGCFVLFIYNMKNIDHQNDNLMCKVIVSIWLSVCLLSFHRPRCTGEDTVDLPLTKDTTFPRSFSLPLIFSERAPSVVVEVDCTQF